MTSESLLSNLVQAMWLVFENDWPMTRSVIEDGEDGSLIKAAGTFLKPGVEDETSNWANRAVLLSAYRQAAAYLEARVPAPSAATARDTQRDDEGWNGGELKELALSLGWPDGCNECQYGAPAAPPCPNADIGCGFTACARCAAACCVHLAATRLHGGVVVAISDHNEPAEHEAEASTR